ncbi:S9 family peptidase [Alistipes ihumii AP11]|uniref:S9 family peptidase n=1 Tax=Alistipes ihumii AP11 TaxID=1211813 RepID=A0ABY5V166_9BACT|nr:S9 family peptidase [Alistipes ihumii]UWN57951.1 S9 family peptidase [Alistipes ihumii AP11]
MNTITVSARPAFDYSALRDGTFEQKTVSGVRSLSDGERYTTMSDGRVLCFLYRTGEPAGVLFDASAAEPRIEFTDYVLSADERRLLLTTDVEPIYRHSFTAEYWIYDRQDGSLRRLSQGGPQQQAQFSPDGSRVAFVRGGNLFVADPAAGSERQLTFDGRFNHIINGLPDWVYEEEFSFARAFAWSPDGRKIAYLRFDESRVKQYNMNRFAGGLYPENYTFKYPKAGEQNSVVELYCCDAADGSTVRMDTGEQTDQYIPRLFWTPTGQLGFYRLNRLQNHFEVLLCDSSGASRVVYDERNDRYVERVDGRTVTFLPDGDRFVVRSERDGFMHLYLYSVSEGLLDRITSGEWEVTELLGIEGDRVYYLSTETSPLRRDLYTVRLDGRGKRRLTGGDGTYRIAPSRGFRYFISYFSNVRTPNRVTLHRSDGRLVRTLEDNAALRTKLDELQVPVKEFFRFATSEGVELNGYMVRPNGFDSSRRYPVLMTQYSGPGSQQAADRWTIGWEDVLVQQGYIVACVDGRGTGFRGEEFKKCTYGELGKYETVDQIEAARYLASLPYVDPDRIGIYGWSYGGFMALNCILKGNDVFRAAIAVAPVTSWRFYDTIYTEIYNGLPQDNPSGYDDNSPIHFADRLKGKLLIAHGTGDDNVHIQNTYEMITRLVEYDKPFELYVYPDRNHGMGPSRHHLMERCIEFVQRNL